MEKDKIKTSEKQKKTLYEEVLLQNKLWTKLFWGNNIKNIIQNVIDMLPNVFNGKLLDFPSGTGDFTYDKYKFLPHAYIACVDPSTENLEKAKALFGNNIDNVHFFKGNSSNLPFPYEHFEVVLSLHGLHSFKDKDNALMEITRVMKKDSLFCGCCYIKGERRISDFIVNKYLSRDSWFEAPVLTKKELDTLLKNYFKSVILVSDKSIAYFKCIK